MKNAEKTREQLISELEEMERRLARLEEARARDRRTAEELVRAVSHDLRTPLTVVQGHAQVIELYADNAELTRDSARTIVRAALRMNLIIQDLVEVVRLENGQLLLDKRAVHLGPFAEELLERSSRTLEVERIKLGIPFHLPPVHADPDRLERILFHLLTNALKFSPATSDVELKANVSGTSLTVSVEDRGVGIAEADLPLIFHRLYEPRAGRKRGSVGLGLHIARMLVEAHDGRIWVESAPGQGSTFSFALPIVGG